MLIIVSGPDRVGKSTLINKLSYELEDCMVAHHGAPPSDQKSIFDFYRDDILRWANSTKEHCICDRAWPCSYILEQFRRNNLGHLEDLIDLELWVNDVVSDGVVHVGQFRPWCWSAPLHIEELKEELDESQYGWYLRDQYITRMQEHEAYQTQLLDFYDRVTMFPNVQLYDSQVPHVILEKCKLALQESGR